MFCYTDYDLLKEWTLNVAIVKKSLACNPLRNLISVLMFLEMTDQDDLAFDNSI